MPRWHNLVLRKSYYHRYERKPGTRLLVSLFPQGFPGSNPGRGVVSYLKQLFQKRNNPDNPHFTFEAIYETLGEAMQSLMAGKGYKPYSHEATIAFLQEYYYFTHIEIGQLDQMRKDRNDCMYYAKK